MPSLLDLPNELLIYIANVGCELTFSFGEESKDDSEVKVEPPLPTDRICVPRKKKPFAKLISDVCCRLRQVVEGSDGRLWETLLTLSGPTRVDEFTMYGPEGGGIRRLTQFRDALRTSEGSDIDIRLESRQRWQIPHFHPEEEEAVKARIFMHAIAMLVPYYRQWRSFRLNLHQPEALYLLLSIINGVSATPNLVFISINKDVYPGIDLLQERQERSHEIVDALQLYSFAYKDIATSFLCARNLSSLIHLDIHGLTIFGSLTIPPNLESLCLSRTTPDGTPNSWEDFQSFISRCRTVRRLQFELQLACAFPNRQATSDEQIILTDIQHLHLMGDLLSALSFLDFFPLPSLTNFQMKFVDDPVLPRKEDLRNLALPSLRSVQLVSVDFDEAVNFIICLRSPVLSFLELHFYVPQQGHSSFSRERTWPSEKLAQPVTLLLGQLPPVATLFFLSYLDLSSLVRLTIGGERSRKRDMGSLPKTNGSPYNPKLLLPHLELLELGSTPDDPSLHVFAYLEMPRLSTLRFTSPGSIFDGYALREQWKSFAATYSELLGRIIELALMLPPFVKVPHEEHPLYHFKIVERLEIFLAPSPVLSNGPVEWMTSTYGTTEKGHSTDPEESRGAILSPSSLRSLAPEYKQGKTASSGTKTRRKYSRREARTWSATGVDYHHRNNEIN